MEIIKVKNYEEVSKKAAELIVKEINNKPDLNICYAVGNSSIGMFNEIVSEYNKGMVNFKNTKAFLLDEYCNNTYHLESGARYFLKTYLLNKVNIKSQHIFSPNADQLDLNEACNDYDQLLKENKIDLAILGIGANGHIGYNEPYTSFNSTTHIQKLELRTRLDRLKFFGNNLIETPTHAVTVGIKNILEFDKIILIISGTNKKEALKKLLNDEITEEFPASSLKKHKSVIVITDEEACSD